MKGRLVVDHQNYITDMLRDLAKERGFWFNSKPEHSWGMNDWSPVQCWMGDHIGPKKFKANFQVQQMPGCCAVLVLSYIQVKPWSYELFDQIVEFVEVAAKNAAFGSVAMTQCVPAFSKMLWKEEPWTKALDRGWVATPAFRNGKSGNLVTYLLKDLGQNAKVVGFEVRYVE
jgi:hypothetical protein